MAGVLFVVAVCLVLAASAVRWALQQRRREDLAQVAVRHGLQHSAVDPFGCTRVAFPLFRKGDGRLAENVVWRDRADGLPVRAFDFSYYTERRDDAGEVVRSHKHFSCVMAQVDGAWPELSITREGILDKALGLVGMGDIELESDQFNRMFALHSPDRRFAVTFVDAQMIDFLLSTHARLAFFVKGRWVLVVSDPVRPDLVPALMAVGERFVERIPRVVYELWPSPFRDAQGRPLPAGDEAYGLAVALAEAAERDPWTVLRSGPFRALEHEGGPEYDLDGNLVEPRPEDPWGRSPKHLPE
ncbi:MAG: hypothetical protein ACJ739_11675 [Acidimicrobiales bacterium]